MNCRNKTAASLIISIVAALGLGRDIYVTTNGAGGGDPLYGAWENASSNIQWAVNVGENGDNVWISNGTYYLTNQVTVNSNITICGNTGELVVVNGNNANRCFYFTNTVNTAGVLSNLFITGGNTNGNGAGVYMYSGAVLDCVFSNNSCPATAANVFRGGGMYFVNNGTIQRCTFIANVASSNGGGMYFYTGSGIIQHCSFINNNANDGGGLYLWKSVNVRIDACLFQTNVASNSAGGLYTYICSNTVITGCDFICNVATTNDCGGGAHLYFGVTNIMTHCTISSNVAIYGEAGGLRTRGSGWTVSNSFISNNISLTSGGGIYMREGTVKNCTIAHNTSIIANGNNQGGGGIFAYADGNNFIQDCIVENNKAGYEGGGIMIGNAIVRNCLIRNNIASVARGGGVRTRSAVVSLVNCTIVSNWTGSTGGGGIYNSYEIKVENCIIYNNASSAAAYSNYYNSSVDASFSNCCFAPAMDAAYTNYSANNIYTDPQFIDWPGGNYRLNKGSPCVNTGVNRDWMTNAVDLDGRTRIRYGRVDMGAYERINQGTIYKFH